MPTASVNVPIWWTKIVGDEATPKQIRDLARAVDRAGISRNDKNAIQELWYKMRGIRAENIAREMFKELK